MFVVNFIDYNFYFLGILPLSYQPPSIKKKMCFLEVLLPFVIFARVVFMKMIDLLRFKGSAGVGRK